MPRHTFSVSEYCIDVVVALKAYRDGQRTHGTMNVQAMSMSEQDMADIGAFWQGMGK
ncbi:MAG: hypothetical protein KDK08_18280 [Rhizobiaceae bacterium]|nr:hypothetical protein [Rhizobiaceae bacterium]